MKTITLTPDASGMVDWPTLSNDKKSVVTIGSFDGMHQGHQAVIRRVVELAKKEQSFSVVVLFDPRPALVHGYAAPLSWHERASNREPHFRFDQPASQKT